MAPMPGLSPEEASIGFRKNSTSSGARSRSTSAGSIPSDGIGTARSSTCYSFDLQKSSGNSHLQRPLAQEYANKMHELPEYDYPTPWSISQAPELPDMEFPAPLVIKNTFVDFDIGRPLSLEDFFEERQIQSCPASGLSSTPDLEDLSEPDEVADELIAEKATPASSRELVTPRAFLPQQEATTETTELKTEPLTMHRFSPVGIPMDVETPRFLPAPPQHPPVLDSNWLSPVSPVPLHDPQAFDIEWQSPVAPPMHVPHVTDIGWRSPVRMYDPHVVDNVDWQSPVSAVQAQVSDHDWQSSLSLPATAPVVLDLLHALASPLARVPELSGARHPGLFQGHSTVPGFSLPPVEASKDTLGPEPELGSPECPTVGSERHWEGVCKPCAFFHTRGCDNGVMCPFCHICDQGEKKRRARDKRLERRARQQASQCASEARVRQELCGW